MKTVSYKATYDKVPVVIRIEDDDEEGLEEVIHFLNDNARIVKEKDDITLVFKNVFGTHTKPLRMDGTVQF